MCKPMFLRFKSIILEPDVSVVMNEIVKTHKHPQSRVDIRQSLFFTSQKNAMQ